MDKQDIAYVVAALVIVIVVAVFIKPIVSPQPVNTDNLTWNNTIQEPQPEPVALQPTPKETAIIPTPTPRVTWDKNATDISFVDPSGYGVSFNESRLTGTRIDNVPINNSMVTFATISGQYDGTSQIIYMPFPYWELWYTVEPSGETGGKDLTLDTSTVTGPKLSGLKGSGSSQTVIEGSYSIVIPLFTIQVMDGKDPNRIVRTITPPGGIDKELWTDKSIETEDLESVTIPDPRPWKEKFYEGEKDYFFIINSKYLDSYTIELKVPQKYLDSNSTSLM